MSHEMVNAIDAVKQAKEHFASRYRSADWCKGIGIGRRGGGYVLRVNVAPGGDIPDALREASFEGVPLEVVRIGTYEPR